MNLNDFTNEELESLRIDVANEVERRERIASIPVQVAELVSRYVSDGGDVAELEGII